MNKEFIPYEQALELKELGFDEPCFSLYLDNDKKTMTSSMKGADTNSWLKAHYSGYRNSITAPLYQQAFRFLREMIITRISDETSYLEGHFTLLPLIYFNGYEIHVTPESTSFTSNMNYNFIPMYEFPSKRKIYKESADNYDNAQLACLKRMIQIIKNK